MCAPSAGQARIPRALPLLRWIQIPRGSESLLFYGSHGPQAHCRCWHVHVRAAMSPRRPARTRPCTYGDVGVTRSVSEALKCKYSMSFLPHRSFQVQTLFEVSCMNHRQSHFPGYSEHTFHPLHRICEERVQSFLCFWCSHTNIQ